MGVIPRPVIAIAFGTRPEAIKLAPVIIEARQARYGVTTRVICSGQHRELLEGPLGLFGIEPDHNLGVMRPGQRPEEVLARVLGATVEILLEEPADVMVVQGDTTTALAAALAAFHQRVPVAHVEAGLRSHQRYHPFPEEMNRCLIGSLATYHFAPTDRARRNLLAEGVDDTAVYVTGNTGIDALLAVASDPSRCALPLGLDLPAHQRVILVTAHRRDNFGAPLERICRALRILARTRPNVHILVCLHPNPQSCEFIAARLSQVERITLAPPVHYGPFVGLMKRASILLTDSGGIQEEGPALGRPVLVMRDETERVEAIEAGCARLIGTRTQRIVDEVTRLLDNPIAYAEMVGVRNPYGDGKASQRILSVLANDLAPASRASSRPVGEYVGLVPSGEIDPKHTEDAEQGVEAHTPS